jgi:hypothetical protein
MEHRFVLLSAVLALSAIPAEAQVRDSSGVRIVTSSADALINTLPWTVDPQRKVVLGSAGGTSDFGSVAGGVLLKDGRIAVLDGLGRELRWFNAKGDLVKKAGRGGRGPGEFQSPMLSPTLYGDSIVAADMLGRVSLFSPKGVFARSVEARAMIGTPRGIVGRSIVMTRGNGFSGSDQGWKPSSFSLDLIDLGDGSRKEVAVLQGPLNLFAVLGGASAMADASQPPSVRLVPLPLSAQPSVAAGGDAIWTTDGVSYSVVRRSRAGVVESVYRINSTPPAIRVNVLRAEKQRIVDVEENPVFKKKIADYLDDAPQPKQMAAFDRLVVDGSEGVWARVYEVGASATRNWIAFDHSGHASGIVRLPADLEILGLDANRLLAMTKDEDDVSSVVVMLLRR